MRGAIQILFSIILLACTITAHAQKLPDKQVLSLRAPANMKIDGKATEWGDKFQAYNNATGVFYTIANDDENLYLTIKGTAPEVVRRILNGSITLTINKTEKSDKAGMSITYPFFDDHTPMLDAIFKNKPQILEGSPSSVSLANAYMDDNNRKITAKIKYIKVNGIPGLDSLVSVYNSDGIKAAALFDNTMAYTYELAVSLKNLGMSIDNPIKFNYNIRINAVTGHGYTIERNAEGKVTAVEKTEVDGQLSQAATGFWGEYTLLLKW
jgi:hypothetical protein